MKSRSSTPLEDPASGQCFGHTNATPPSRLEERAGQQSLQTKSGPAVSPPTGKSLSVPGVDGRFWSSELGFTEFQHDHCLINGCKIKGRQPGGD